MAQQRIDMHAHFYGGGLVEALSARRERPFLRREAGQLWMEAMNGAFPFGPAYHDINVGLAQMDGQGLTHRLLTFPGALGVDVLPAEQISGAISRFNDHLAELHQRTSGRILGLGGLPLADLDASADEVVRLRRDLGLPGVLLPGNDFGSIERAEALAPVLDAANEVGCHIMVHPGLGVGEVPPPRPSDNMQYRTSALALQDQIAQTALTLILSDMLDRWPRLSFQVVNLGGTLPFIVERCEAIARHRSPDAPFPTERLRRLWYDTASLGPRALEAAVALYGAERVMLGSDFPIFRDDPVAMTLEPSHLPEADKARIAGGNAAALMETLGVPLRA